MKISLPWFEYRFFFFVLKILLQCRKLIHQVESVNYLKIMTKVVRATLNSIEMKSFELKELWTVGRSMFQEMLSSFPGIDEAVSFSEVMK